MNGISFQSFDFSTSLIRNWVFVLKEVIRLHLYEVSIALNFFWFNFVALSRYLIVFYDASLGLLGWKVAIPLISL